jgi:hypothetical protein
MVKKYLTVDGVEFVEFTCNNCGQDKHLVPRKLVADEIDGMVCSKCCKPPTCWGGHHI